VSLFRFFTLLAFTIPCSTILHAQLPNPDLKTIFPQGIQAGTSTEVTISGTELEETTTLRFSHPGLTVEPITLPATDYVPAKANPLRYRITAAPDIPSGIYEVSAQTRLGLTAPRAFVVSHLPEKQHGTNHSPETAEDLPLDTIINGHVDNAAIDHYKVTLTQHQTIHLHCQAQALDSRFDPTLTLLSPDGVELARANDRSPLDRDAALTFKAPSAGTYLLKVHDFTFIGGGEHPYRLLASTQPIPHSPEPLLPTQEHSQDISLTLSKSPVYHSLAAKKDQPLWIELLSARLHQPSDSLLIIEQVTPGKDGTLQYKEVASNDDFPLPSGGRHFPIRTADSALRFDPPVDGQYRFTLLNQFSHPAPAKLRIHPPASGYRLIAVPWHSHQKDNSLPRQTTLIRQGGTARIQLFVIRESGLDEPITLTIDNLPPGVDFQPKTIAPHETSTTLILTSQADTPSANTFLTIKGTTNGKQTIAQPATSSWHVGNWDTELHHTRLAQLLPLSITHAEKAPLALTPAATTFTHKIGETLEIPFTLAKNAEIKGDITVALANFPHSKPPQLIIKPDATEGKFTLALTPSNELKIAPKQTHHFTLQANFTLSHQNNLPALEHARADLKRLEDLEKSLQSESKPIPPALTEAKTKAADHLRQQTESSKPRDLTHSVHSPLLTLTIAP
jgi:hypothetical protein